MFEQDTREKWKMANRWFQDQFGQGETLDLDGILFVIGVRELGQPKRRFKKDEKVDLLHIAICRILMPYGIYRLVGQDQDGWPHYERTSLLPHLKPGEQSVLVKEAIVRYLEEEGIPYKSKEQP